MFRHVQTSHLPGAKPLAGKRILIVDDEPACRESYRFILQAAGATCVLATEGDEALALFSQQQSDCVVTDYAMPGMRGDSLAAKLRELSPSIRIVLLNFWEGRNLPADQWSWDAMVLSPITIAALTEAVQGR